MFPNQSNWESPDQNTFLLEMSCPQTPKNKFPLEINVLLPKKPKNLFWHVSRQQPGKQQNNFKHCFLQDWLLSPLHLWPQMHAHHRHGGFHQRLSISTMSQKVRRSWKPGNAGTQTDQNSIQTEHMHCHGTKASHTSKHAKPTCVASRAKGGQSGSTSLRLETKDVQ